MNCPHCDAPETKNGFSLRRPHCPGRPSCNWVRCTVCASYWGTGQAHHCGTNDCTAEKEKPDA